MTAGGMSNMGIGRKNLVNAVSCRAFFAATLETPTTLLLTSATWIPVDNSFLRINTTLHTDAVAGDKFISNTKVTKQLFQKNLNKHKNIQKTKCASAIKNPFKQLPERFIFIFYQAQISRILLEFSLRIYLQKVVYKAIT